MVFPRLAAVLPCLAAVLPCLAAVRLAAASGGRIGVLPTLAAHPKLTGRAAVLAIVVCAIALTLAYPVREYISDRRQLDQLAVANGRLATEVGHLRAQAKALNSPSVIEQQARDNLHMCFPSQTCYEVILPAHRTASKDQAPSGTPWYGQLWQSVRQADRAIRGQVTGAR